MALTPLQHRNKVANLMLHLKCTETEAEDIIAYDEAVDKGEPTKYDLTAEQKNIVSQAHEKKSLLHTNLHNESVKPIPQNRQ